MKKTMYMLPVLLFFIYTLTATTTTAEEPPRIDCVILASTVNYPDAFIGAAAANKIGAPLLLTTKDQLPPETEAEIRRLAPVEVYLIGGPEVISYEQQSYILNISFTNLSIINFVTRIWGITSYGTSAKVARRFWLGTGAETVVIVPDTAGTPEEGDPTLLAYGRDLAIAMDAPLLLSPKDTLPTLTEETITELRTKKVILVGCFTDEFKTTLQNKNLTIENELCGTEEEIENETEEEIENKTNQTTKPLVIIAVGNWKDTIKAPFHPGKGVTRLIKNETQIPELINDIKTGDYTRIKVVGKPELAQKICEALETENIEHDCITGEPPQTAVKIAEKELELIRKLKERFEKQKEQMMETLAKKSAYMDGECNHQIKVVNNVVKKIGDKIEDKRRYETRVQNIAQTKVECEDGTSIGNVTRRYDAMNQIISEVNLLKWELRELIKKEIQEDMELETKSSRQLTPKINAMLSELRDIKKNLVGGGTKGRECLNQIDAIEELNNQGMYANAFSRMCTTLEECNTTLEEATSQTTTTKSTTTTSTTRKGQGGKP